MDISKTHGSITIGKKANLIITKTSKGFCIILNAACKKNDVKQIEKFLSKDHKYFLNNDPRMAISFAGVRRISAHQGRFFTIIADKSPK